MFKEVSKDTIIKKVRNSGSYFFSKDTMRFFNCIVDEFGYIDYISGDIYIITSERFDYNAPRLYTVRRFKLNGDNFYDHECINRFQEFKNYEDAYERLIFMVGDDEE